MDHRISTLISALENDGWSFTGPADVKSGWWFKEIYTLTSVWAPREVNLYITLLIDPQDDKKEEVWAAGFSTEIPSQHFTTWLMQPTLKDLGRIDITGFIKELNTLARTSPN